MRTSAAVWPPGRASGPGQRPARREPSIVTIWSLVRAPLTREVGLRFGVFTLAVFLPLQLLTGIALAAHRGITVQSLAEPGYGRTLAAKLVLFAAVLLVAGLHGMAVGRGQERLARIAGIATLLGSVGVVLLATALVP